VRPHQEQRDPLRLTRQSGSWFLEFTRLVAVDEHLMRPERRRVPATLDALRAAAQSCPPERIREAEALMQQADDGSERAFELDDDGWLWTSPLSRSQRPLARAEVSTLVAELRAELLGVRALCEALRSRVAALEAAEHARRSEALAQEPKSIAKVPSRRDVLSALQGTVPADVPQRQVAAPVPHVADAGNVATAGKLAAQAAEPVLAGVAEHAPETGGLSLPRAAEVLDCLQLLAPDVALEPQAREPPSELDTLFVALLVDESKEERGALVVDARAAAALGGGLLGLPWSTRELQGERGLERDTFEALSEIANNLGGLVNRVNPKCYTRLGALERPLEPAPAWLSSSVRRVGFATAKGGRLWLIAR
jgi:hypothetical protein